MKVPVKEIYTWGEFRNKSPKFIHLYKQFSYLRAICAPKEQIVHAQTELKRHEATLYEMYLLREMDIPNGIERAVNRLHK